MGTVVNSPLLCYHYDEERMTTQHTIGGENMNETVLRTFPENEYEALAMLYVQSQNLTDKTPEDLLVMYQDAYKRIRELRKSQRNANSQSWKF